jgi:hypothetical protein
MILASMAIVLTIQQQDVAAFNDKNNQGLANSHSHINLTCTGGTCLGNEGTVVNSENVHSNENFNNHRDDTTHTNSFVKPGNENPGI